MNMVSFMGNDLKDEQTKTANGKKKLKYGIFFVTILKSKLMSNSTICLKCLYMVRQFLSEI